MEEPFPASIGNPLDEQQEISTNSVQTNSKSDFLLDVGEAVTNRRSGNLASVGTKRYGMTNFEDGNVQQDLLQEFDPLSCDSNSVHNEMDEDLSQNTNKPTFIQRLDSRENMELHRASGLVLGRIKETNLANPLDDSGDEEESSSGFTVDRDCNDLTRENDGISESCKNSNDFVETAEVADEGENSHFHRNCVSQESSNYYFIIRLF